MSKEVELPPLDATISDVEVMQADLRKYRGISRDGMVLSLCVRERQLREAIALFATLTAQVETEVTRAHNAEGNAVYQQRMREKAEAELAVLQQSARINHDESKQEIEHLRAELEVLREEARVTYRVEFLLRASGVWERVPALYQGVYSSYKEAAELVDFLKDANMLRIVEVIARERILDAIGETK